MNIEQEQRLADLEAACSNNAANVKALEGELEKLKREIAEQIKERVVTIDTGFTAKCERVHNIDPNKLRKRL